MSGTVGGAALAGVIIAAVILAVVPADAADVFVEVNPSTVQAGSSVSIRASCGGDNLTPAKVESGAFGEQQLLPQDGVLSAMVTVPANTKADTYAVILKCDGIESARTNLTVLRMAMPTRGPDTGGGGMANSGGEDERDNDRANPAVLIGGIASLAAGGLLGFVAVRRRRGRVPS